MNNCDKNCASVPAGKLCGHQEVLRDLGTEWEKELKEIWNTDRGTSHDNYIALVSFIAELLASQRKTLLREVEGMKLVSPNYSDGHADHCRSWNAALGAVIDRLAPPTDL